MTYAETVEYLCGLEASRGWDLKLERVRAALAALGSPEAEYPAVLIAGTNGKGTTAALTAAAFARAGVRVGLYTSPHLVHFTERIRIDGDEIARDAVVALVAEILRVAPPAETGLTFFEVTTLVALLAFSAADVDLAILEVGLGGRLDATNVVEPLASAVVSIDY
ncbi:MAG: bifunctional folylpolyglutamate synthase/dihydrofolate synthase, partial [bacterium]